MCARHNRPHVSIQSPPVSQGPSVARPSYKGPETFKGPAENHRFGAQTGPQTGRSQATNARGGVHKLVQTDSEQFRTGFGVLRPRSKTFKLRDSSAEWGCQKEAGDAKQVGFEHCGEPSTFHTSRKTVMAAPDDPSPPPWGRKWFRRKADASRFSATGRRQTVQSDKILSYHLVSLGEARQNDRLKGAAS